MESWVDVWLMVALASLLLILEVTLEGKKGKGIQSDAICCSEITCLFLGSQPKSGDPF
jgi:hypothetical protein